MSQMLQEMAEQPRLLQERGAPLLEQAREAIGDFKPQLVVFAARGSSDNACIYARYLFEVHLGIPCSLAAPSVLTKYHANLEYPPALVIGVSQSAAAPDVAAVLQNARDKGHRTVSVTNEESGAVIDSSEHHIFLGAGEEKSVAATKTFTLTLLALEQICRALGGEPPPVEGWRYAPESSEDDVQAILSASIVFALGRGYNFAIALEAALKLMECALIPCKPFSTADFAHGPVALADAETAAIVFGDEQPPDGPQIIRAPSSNVYEGAFFAQRLAYDVAIARGLDPDSPRNLSKVTRTR